MKVIIFITKPKMSITDSALGIYCTMQAINVIFLVVDYVIIIKTDYISISQFSYKYPVIGSLIVLTQFVSPLSLAVHFICLKMK